MMNWIRRLMSTRSRTGDRPAPPARAKLALETLGDRITPAHLNPSGEPVLLPEAATHGDHGIQTAIEAPGSHIRKLIIIDY